MKTILNVGKCCLYRVCAPLRAEIAKGSRKLRCSFVQILHGKCTKFCTENALKNVRRNRDRNAQPIAVCIAVFARYSARILTQCNDITI